MRVKLIFKISNREKNSRWLVEDENNNRYSALISNEKNCTVGESVDVPETDLCSETYEEKYNKFLSGTKHIKDHLIKYAEERNLKTNGKWNNTPYEHILINEKENLLTNYGYKSALERIYDKQKEKGNIHKGFANLNSSQAFTFNFFAPLIEEKNNNVDLFTKLLCDDSLDFSYEYEFEKVMNNDKTQLDFYLESGSRKFSFEVKYSENAFGDADKDENHIIKYDNFYKAKLNEILSSFDPDAFEEQFFEEYQLWRNICGLCNDNTTVCFVFHKYRTDLIEKIENAKKVLKNDQLRNRIKIIKVNDFVDDIIATGTEQQKSYYSEFKKKYLELEE